METARAYAQEKLQPRILEAYGEERTDPGDLYGNERTRPAGAAPAPRRVRTAAEHENRERLGNPELFIVRPSALTGGKMPQKSLAASTRKDEPLRLRA
jgi:hypothetical protein